MKPEIQVHEKYSKYWPAVTVLSSVMAFLLYILSEFRTEILLSGYLQLGAFILFSVAVFSFFKLRDGRITIDLTVDNDDLSVKYLLRDREIAEELIPLSEIDEIMMNRMPDKSLYTEINRSDRTLSYKKNKSDGWKYLFKYNGRVVPLYESDAESVIHFIRDLTK